MPASLFTRYPGTLQGRIAPARWVPPLGSYVFALGSDAPGVTGKLNGGDYTAVEQTGDTAGVATLRFRLHHRGAGSAPPAGARWRAEWMVDGVAHGRRDLWPGHEADDTDGLLVVKGALPDAQVQVRLTYLHPGATEPDEVELPAVYVDALAEQPADLGPALANRWPLPGEVEVPRDARVEFSLVDTNTGSAIALNKLRVYIGGVLALDGSLLPSLAAFSGPFQGPDSAVVQLAPDHARVVLHALGLWGSEQVVDVRVVAAGTSGWELDETYAWTVVDETPPLVTGAVAFGPREVRVAFSEPMGTSAGALAAGAYVLDSEEEVAFVPGVLSVTPLDASLFAVRLDGDLSYGKTYRIRVTGAPDAHGNVIAPPFNRATFTAYAPPDVPRRALSLYGFLPARVRSADARQGGTTRRLFAALEEVARTVLEDIDRFPDLLDPDRAPEWAVDMRLGDLGNPFPFYLPLPRRRLLLRNLIAIYQLKGLDAGIRALLRFFLALDPVEVLPYDVVGGSLGDMLLDPDELDAPFELGLSNEAGPYTFHVRVPRALTPDERVLVRWLVDYIKPDHTHFLDLLEPPGDPTLIDHVELGLSLLGDDEFQLH